MAKKKQNLPSLKDTPILQPLDISKIGSNGDPCFGLQYDLSTEECRMCGDSELCCIKFANSVGKTRKQLEKESQFKDLEQLVDMVAAKKTYRALKRKGDDKKTIVQKLQAKYELSLKEARELYRKFTSKQSE